MTTEYAYDPELPYVIESKDDGALIARFAEVNTASNVARLDFSFNVIDTTPKPKIPEDAEFITWGYGAGQEVAFRENFNPRKPWSFYGGYYSSEALIELIGDAEVTVLVPKGDSK